MIASFVALGLTLIVPQLERDSGSNIARARAAEISEGKLSPADRARDTAVQFGQCVVGRAPDAALRSVGYFPTTTEAHKALIRMATAGCLAEGELKMPQEGMRGALFIGLYRREFQRASPPSGTDQKVNFAAGAPDPRSSADDQAIALRSFVDCTARLDPTDARAAVMVPVGSRAEAAAYSGLAPHFSACLVQGSTLHFSKMILQGVLAEVLYRNAKVATQAGVR